MTLKQRVLAYLESRDTATRSEIAFHLLARDTSISHVLKTLVEEGLVAETREKGLSTLIIRSNAKRPYNKGCRKFALASKYVQKEITISQYEAFLAPALIQ